MFFLPSTDNDFMLQDEMRMHDMENVTMRRVGSHLLALEVPGLAEKRPSLVYGDRIFVKPIDDAFDSKPYEVCFSFFFFVSKWKERCFFLSGCILGTFRGNVECYMIYVFYSSTNYYNIHYAPRSLRRHPIILP